MVWKGIIMKIEDKKEDKITTLYNFFNINLEKNKLKNIHVHLFKMKKAILKSIEKLI